MFKKYVMALAFAAPVVAHAGVTLSMACDSSVRDFFAPLVQKRLINTKPYEVQDGYLNVFKPKMFAGLNVYGMKVSAVFGYTDDPLLFTRPQGDHVAEVYGVVVKESIANVQAQLIAVGATSAKTLRVDAHSTAISCKG